MARMPGATWLGEHSPQTPMARYDIYCVHTIVGFAPAHAAHFSTWMDGRLGQSRDTKFRSAANLFGNHRVIACENEDGARVVPLTDAQIVANGKAYHWCHETHGIPLEMCPNSRPESRGLAYHRQGIDGNFGTFDFPGRVPGGEVWSESFGKICPMDVRIRQLPLIMDVARTLKRGGQIGDPMPDPKDLWEHRIPVFATEDPDDKAQAETLLSQTHARATRALQEAAQANNRAGRIEEALKILSRGIGKEVGDAVNKALEDAVIEVDVNVNQGDPPA